MASRSLQRQMRDSVDPLVWLGCRPNQQQLFYGHADTEALRGYDRFLVRGMRLFVLRPESFPIELRGPTSRVYAQRIGPETPGPALKTDVDVRIS